MNRVGGMEACFAQKSVMLSQVVIISDLHNVFMKINYKSATCSLILSVSKGERW